MMTQFPNTSAPSPHNPSITHYRALTIPEQMGTDPTSQLARAIDRLANAIERLSEGGTKV